MNMCIDGENLRLALADIKSAEDNGFYHCLAVFDLVSAGRNIDSNRLEYSDLVEKAHPTDARLDWGRYQGVTKANRFINGKLVRIKQEE